MELAAINWNNVCCPVVLYVNIFFANHAVDYYATLIQENACAWAEVGGSERIFPYPLTK